jgi:hypothetical protein
MAKKPRSQRRKKGSSMEGGDGADSTDVNLNDAEMLSESHTIASLGSVATFEDGWDIGNDADSIDEALAGGSVNSQTNAVAAAEARFNRLTDALATIGELPSEKRTTRREATLRKAFKALTQYATGNEGAEYAENRQDGIVAACKYSIRVGSPAEQYAACRVLEATSVILGADHPDLFEAIEPYLLRVLQSTIKAIPVRVAALRAMTMAVFIGTSDDVTTEHLLDICEAVTEKEYRNQPTPVSLRAAALDAWALLSTTVPDFYIAGKDHINMGRGLAILPLLKECLDDAAVQLRSAAGEALALIHEARLNLGIADEQGDDTNTNTTQRKYSQGSWDGTEWEEVIHEIQQRIAQLAVESGHHMKKKAKKEQRATFREFQATLVDDESPQQVVNFRGGPNGSLELKTWKEIVQLNFIRHCLQGGFQAQLLTNATLQAIFGANGALAEFSGYSQLEKRLILSKTSEAAKEADQELSKKRRNRTNAKNQFLTADGDDI